MNRIARIKLYATVFAFAFAIFELAAQNFQWAQSAGGANSDYGKSVATDIAGNAYVTGYYNSTSITFGSNTLTNTGSYDIFLVKYDPTGNVQWAKTASGSSYNYSYSVSTDCGVGHILIAGAFGGTLTFPTTPVATTLTASAGGADIFLAEYDANGNVLWAKSAGGSSSDFAYSVTTDYACNIYITGYFDSPTATFGSTTLTNSTSGWNNVFIAKYDTSGNVMWAHNAAATGNSVDKGKCVVHNNNGVYITGNFSSSITFGSTTLTSNGSDDLFIVNYDLNGNVNWAKSAGGTADETGVAIAANSNSNNVYLTGNFNSQTFPIGSVNLTNSSSPPFYYDDVFLARYDSLGNVIWAKNAGGIHQDRASGLTSDLLAQNVYVTGAFLDTIVFGSTLLISPGTANTIFVAKYDLNGNLLWTKQAGGTSSDNSSGEVCEHWGTYAYLTGYYTSSPIGFDANTLSNSGNEDVFLSKLIDLTTRVSNSESFGDNVMAFPNPSDGHLVFQSAFVQDVDLVVYDMLGNEVFSRRITSLEKTIDLSFLENGIYCLVLSDQSHTALQKICITR